MEWLWLMIPAVVVFVVWAGRRAGRRYDDTWSFQRSGPRFGTPGAKPTGGKRRAR